MEQNILQTMEKSETGEHKKQSIPLKYIHL